jgi:hypothetical protein
MCRQPLEKEVMSNRQHPVASRNHILLQILREKESPKLDPPGSTPDNLQFFVRVCLLKPYHS